MEVPGNWFKDWFGSPYYHMVYSKRNDLEAEVFINRIIEYLKPAPGSFMIEMGCGKGRHSKILASAGFDVTGVDLSFDNILEARNNESENLHFFQHDMRLPFWINYFQYAFNLFTSFGYFSTKREHHNAIRTIAHALRPNGMLILDYLNVQFEQDHMIHQSDEKFDGIYFHVTRWHDETHFYKKIIIEDPQLREPLEYMEKVAKFTLADFKDMFASNQLHIQEVFGDYQLDSYEESSSPRLLMIAKK